MKDYPFALFIVMLVVVVWSIYMAKNLLEKLEEKETQPLDSSKNVNTEKYEIKGGGGEAIIIPKKVSTTYKEVLKKDNCSSTTKPANRTHLNNKQNLTKYNHGTYRDEKGRFQSKKEWKKEQNHS